MQAFVLTLVLGQCVGPGCSAAPVAAQAQPATVRLIVEPPDGEVWLDGHRVQSQGRVRVLVTPPLLSDRRYFYRVKARWGDSEREWKLYVEPGKTAELKLEPYAGAQDADGVKNFGIDRSRLNGEREHITVDGEVVTKEEVKRLLEGSLTDDSEKLRLTVIGSEEDRRRVLEDLKGPLADVARHCLVQSYPPDHWAVARAGFYTAGRPTIYIQEPSGKVLHRQDDYADGADGLRRVFEAIRRPDPTYDPTKDRDLRRHNQGLSLWVVLGVAGMLFLLSLRKGAA